METKSGTGLPARLAPNEWDDWIQRVEICILEVTFFVVRVVLHRLGCGSGPKRAEVTVRPPGQRAGPDP